MDVPRRLEHEGAGFLSAGPRMVRYIAPDVSPHNREVAETRPSRGNDRMLKRITTLGDVRVTLKDRTSAGNRRNS